MTADVKHIAFADKPAAEYRGLQRVLTLCRKKTTLRHVRPFHTAERAGTCKECLAERAKTWGF